MAQPEQTAGYSSGDESFVPADIEEFRQLPEDIRVALVLFHGDARRMESALLNALRAVPDHVRESLRLSIFKVLGLIPVAQASQRAG